jgi:pyruvate dehydrogenase E2 component (dihydrolipoamide acetyltransferase)
VHSPLVRRLAQERGVELDRIAGTGPGGRITREDVLRCAADDGGAEPAPASKPAAARGRGEERRPVGRLRSTIAENLSRSWREIPHVTSFYDVDASRLMATRQALAARHDTRIPLDALVIAAVVPALRLYPEFNAKLDGDHLILHHHHDVGIAVDTPEGLVVAVVRDAGARPLLETAAEITRLGELAKQRKLAATDVGRQTFTISNIGAVAGGGHGTPIIPLGTAAILAVGRATDSPVVRDGTLAIAPVMPLSFSYDHRIADGGTARRFMTMVVENLADLSLAVT